MEFFIHIIDYLISILFISYNKFPFVLVFLTIGLFIILIFVKSPKSYSEKREMKKCESPIEIRLFESLIKKGYKVYTQIPCGKYRIDLAIYKGRKKIAIEADGKSFHSSINQVKHDKQKDWYLKKHGWEVIRFTGSEIYRNSSGCVKEIEKIL